MQVYSFSPSKAYGMRKSSVDTWIQVMRVKQLPGGKKA